MAQSIIAKIAARAKVIRKASPNMAWQTAIKKASAELKGTKTTTKRKTTSKRAISGKGRPKTYEDFADAYENAPAKVKAILDTIEDRMSYTKLAALVRKLNKLGWNAEYGLDGEIHTLYPIKKPMKRKTSTKKVGGAKTVKKSQPLIAEHKKYFKQLTLAAAKKRYANDKEVYLLYTDGTDSLVTNLSDFSHPGHYALGYEIESVGKAKGKPVSKHKDTKSHNVNIRVMSGTKLPKIPKAGVNMDSLNGVLKIMTGKFYEVIQGENKGSVVKITSQVRPNSKLSTGKQKTYNVDFYEYRNGHLQKCFKAIISDSWINKRSIRPRQSVKAYELNKYF
jgi:hypothetical protein